MDVVGAIYDRCRYHAIGRGFCTKIIHCFSNTWRDEISLYIVYVNYLGSLSSPIFSLTYYVATLKALLNFFKHVICIFCFAISTIIINYLILLLYCLLLYICLILVNNKCSLRNEKLKAKELQRLKNRGKKG